MKRAWVSFESLLLGGLLCLLPGLSAAEDGKPRAALQPDARGSISPDRVVDIEHLALDLGLDLDGGRIEGTATHRVRPLRDGLRQLLFHQVGLNISAVTVDGVSVDFRLNEDSVVVVLPEGMSRARPVQLSFTYSAEPDTGLHFRGPGRDSPDSYPEVWSQGEDEDNRFWFPTFDFPRERFTYEGRFTAKSHLQVISNGKLLSKEPASGRLGYTTWHYALGNEDLVSYLVMVAAAEYRHWQDQWREIPLHYYAAGDADEAAMRRLLGRTGEMMDLLSSLTGTDYPYPVYRQIMVQRFLYTGMENSAATVMDRHLLSPERNAGFNTWGESVVAHELAHQWFGDLLTCRTWRHLWLNEGFATYFGGLWMEKSRGVEYAARRTRQRYAGVMGADKRRPRPLVRGFFNDSADQRSANPYGKGASVLQMLRVLLGDETFSRGIARYVSSHRGQLVQTEDLKRAMEKESGMYLDWFFDQWVYLAGHPKLTVSHQHDADTGTLRVTVKQSQAPGGLVPTFTLPVDIEVATAAGSRVERLWLEGEQASVQLEMAAAPLYVAVDPRGGLLADIDNQQNAAQWAAQLDSKHPYARELALVGLKALKGSSRDEVRARVVQILVSGEAALAHRIGAVEILAAWRSSEDVEALLAALGRESGKGPGKAKLRAELVQALGQVETEERVIRALESLLNKDPVDHVRAAALRALAKLEEERIRPRAIAALRAPATEDMVLQQAGANALRRWGQNSDLRALAAARKAGTQQGLRNSAMWASVQIAAREKLGRDRDTARAQILPDVEQMLWDRHVRARETAVSVLSQIGDRGSVTALQALAAREDYQALRERAERAIEQIRSRRDLEPDATDGQLKARIKAMEERIEGLESELKKVQERR